MPLPMVHFAIAVELAARIQQQPTGAFLLGSIAPDAIHMRPGTDRLDKRRTHLNEPPDTADHAQLYSWLRQHAPAADPQLAFTVGYLAHILADRLWLERVVTPFRSRLASDADPAVIRALYYQETDQIDFDLYHQVPWRALVWEAVQSAVAPNYLPLLSAEEIDQWRQRKLHWFGELKQEPKIRPQYISATILATYIDAAVEAIADQLRRWDVGHLIGED
jgi:hypothetical protein